MRECYRITKRVTVNALVLTRYKIYTPAASPVVGLEKGADSFCSQLVTDISDIPCRHSWGMDSDYENGNGR